MVGLLVSYLLDVMRVREGTLFMAWGTFLAVNFGLLLTGGVFSSGGGQRRPWYVGGGLLLLSGQVYFLAGAWATVQFRWVQLQYPGRLRCMSGHDKQEGERTVCAYQFSCRIVGLDRRRI